MEGLAELREAATLRPGYWQNHYELGIAYYDLGRYPDATAAWSRVVALQPDSAWGHLVLGVAQQAQGKRREAQRSYRKSADLDPSAEAWSNLGQVLYLEGRYDEARDAYEQALRLDPKHAPSYRNLGDLYRRLGDEDRARRRYERAVELQSELVGLNRRCPRPRAARRLPGQGGPLPSGPCAPDRRRPGPGEWCPAASSPRAQRRQSKSLRGEVAVMLMWIHMIFKHLVSIKNVDMKCLDSWRIFQHLIQGISYRSER